MCTVKWISFLEKFLLQRHIKEVDGAGASRRCINPSHEKDRLGPGRGDFPCHGKDGASKAEEYIGPSMKRTELATSKKALHYGSFTTSVQ